ncbi:AarF/ABC1/UbiB kinase family protein [Streptomyces sp. NBC_01356]|uniref:ABC1 kinase family protein n=1 Tax=Streptomyces sp. NBC_01356 TaxID=2903836 RepID=UPI002E3211FD|nr:AarF/ABC1/UbiB kinase family protein [Streptomyces sp. NBC_01356]
MLALLLLEIVLPSSGSGLFRQLSGRILRTRRFLQVSRISARNGLPRYLTTRPSHNTPERNAQFAVALRRTLEESGVTFVKLGQVLSTRRDLLPDEFIDELSKLQNDVPPAPWEEVRLQLTEELGAPPEKYFAAFDRTPLAAASIGQVHRATLPGGQRVVVKIQRPGIVRKVERDLDICRRVAHTLDQRYNWAKSIGAVDLAEGFADALREELDFRVEARNLTTVKVAAAQHDGRNTLKIPEIHEDLTTARVLVMELVDGIPLGRAGSALADRGVEREPLARTLLSALLQQVMVDGVFHADPHPGNILLLPDNTLALLDFGSVGRLDTQLQGSLQRLLLAIDQRDPAALRDAFIEVMAMLPVLRRIPRRAERIAADLERGKLAFNVRLFSHKDDERVAARLLQRVMLTILAATTGIMAVLLLSNDGGPDVSNSLSLHAVFGYNLLIFSVVLMLRVMFNGARRAGGPDT